MSKRIHGTSGGNNPKDAPATMPKGEKPILDPEQLPKAQGVEMKASFEKPKVLWALLRDKLSWQ